MLISGSGLVSHNFVRLDQQGSSANGYFSHRSHTLALLIELVLPLVLWPLCGLDVFRYMFHYHYSSCSQSSVWFEVGAFCATSDMF